MFSGLKSFAALGAVLLSASALSACVSVRVEHVGEDFSDVIGADPVGFDAEFPPSIEELFLYSQDARLNGLAYLANGEGPHPTVILLHGYPGNEKNLDLAQYLRNDGFNVLFFHYRGAWGSEGEFSFSNVIEDVASAVEYLRANAEYYRVDTSAISLIGHSMGGFAALQGAANDASIACVAGIAPADFGRIGGAPAEALEGFSAYSDTMQMLAGWSGEKAVSELQANAESFALAGLAPQMVGKSVLLIAGDQDASVSAEMVEDVAAAYSAEPGIDVEMITLSGDHSFSWSRIALSETVLTWIQDCR